MKKVLLLMLFLSMSYLAAAQSPSNLLDNISIFGEGESLIARITMNIHGTSGLKEREIDIYLSRQKGERKTLLHVVSPVFLSKLKFLSHRRNDGRETKWLATSHGVRRLSQANRNDPLFDSDFSVEDLSEFNTEEYAVSTIGENEINGNLCDLIELNPSGRYRKQLRKVLYVGQSNGFLYGVDYHDEKGTKVKMYRVLSTVKSGNETFPGRCRMDDLVEETYTLIELTELDTATKIPPSVFNKASL